MQLGTEVLANRITEALLAGIVVTSVNAHVFLLVLTSDTHLPPCICSSTSFAFGLDRKNQLWEGSLWSQTRKCGTRFGRTFKVANAWGCDVADNCGEDEWTKTWYLFRQLEKSHWYYEDHFCAIHHKPNCSGDPRYKCFKVKKDDNLFYCAMLDAFPWLRQLIGDLEKAKKERDIAMRKILRVGAILMDVKTFRFLVVEDANTHSYMFPRGKINKEESPLLCMYRELEEEVSLSLRECKRDFVCKVKVNDYGVTAIMYCFVGRFGDTPLRIRCKDEIASFKWLTLRELHELPKKSKHLIDCFDSYLNRMVAFVPRARLRVMEDDEDVTEEEGSSFSIHGAHHGDGAKSNRIVNDDENEETFGDDRNEAVMSVDEFIKRNAMIEHRHISHYNGDPQTFGESDEEEEEQQRVQLNPTPYKHYLNGGDAVFSFDYAKLLNCIR